MEACDVVLSESAEGTVHYRYPLISLDPAVQSHYEHCRGQGTSHALAEMFARGQPPMSNTDREFLEGHCNGNQFAARPGLGDFYRREAEAAGQDTTGKVYLSSLAAFPGDPRAWVSGRGDAQRVCEERGWDCEGSVTVKAARKDHAPGPPVADDIVQEEVDRIVAESPEPVKESRQDLAAKVVEKRKPHWAK